MVTQENIIEQINKAPIPARMAAFYVYRMLSDKKYPKVIEIEEKLYCLKRKGARFLIEYAVTRTIQRIIREHHSNNPLFLEFVSHWSGVDMALIEVDQGKIKLDGKWLDENSYKYFWESFETYI